MIKFLCRPYIGTYSHQTFYTCLKCCALFFLAQREIPPTMTCPGCDEEQRVINTERGEK